MMRSVRLAFAAWCVLCAVLLVLGSRASLLGEDSQKVPTAREPDARLQADGKGWRLDRAKLIVPTHPRVLLIGDSILNGYGKQVITALNGKAYVDLWVNPHCQSEYQGQSTGQLSAASATPSASVSGARRTAPKRQRAPATWLLCQM